MPEPMPSSIVSDATVAPCCLAQERRDARNFSSSDVAPIRGGRDPPGVILKPDMQGLHDRPTSLVSDPLSMLGRMTADLGLDRIEFTNALQHLGCQRRLGRGVEVVELPSCMA